MKKFYLMVVFLITQNLFAQDLDCNGIENGPALIDECGTCQVPYIYNMITHTVTFLNTTYGVNVGENEILISGPDNNIYWDDCDPQGSWWIDCNGFIRGPALVDDCQICRLAYAYNTVTHEVTFVNHTDLHQLAENEIMVMPDDESSPYWNDCTTNIVELSTEKRLLRIVDVLGREISEIRENTPLFYIYNDGSFEKKVIMN